MSPSRALQSLRWLSNNGRLQWQLDRLKPPKVIGKVRKARSQAVVVEPPMLLTLEGRIIEMQQARDPAWTAALSSWLVASGCLRYKHLCLSTPVKISREFFHGHCRKGKQSHNRQGFDWCAPARFSNGWHWADKWLEDYQGRQVRHLLYSWRRLLPTVGSLIRLQDAEIDWQDKVEERVATPFHYSGGKYALSMRTKMRAFLVAAKVADCEAWETVTEEEVAEADEEAKIKAAQACRGDTEVIWAQAPQTTALKRRFSLSQSLVHGARERMRKPAPSARAMPARLGEIFLTGHLKNGTALCPDFNTGECRQDPCAREHLCAMLQQTGRACGGRHPASECRAKRRMTEAKLRELGLPVPADPVEAGATRPAGAPSEAPAQKRRRILPPPLPIAPAGPMSSRPSAEEPASVDTRRPAEPAELPGNFLEIPECLDLNPADSKWDRLATVQEKSAQTPSTTTCGEEASFWRASPRQSRPQPFQRAASRWFASRRGWPSGKVCPCPGLTWRLRHRPRRPTAGGLGQGVAPGAALALPRGRRHRPLHGGASPGRSCCGDVAGDAEGNQPNGRTGEIRRCRDVEITKTLQDRKLAGWVHQALASSSAVHRFHGHCEEPGPHQYGQGIPAMPAQAGGAPS